MEKNTFNKVMTALAATGAATTMLLSEGRAVADTVNPENGKEMTAQQKEQARRKFFLDKIKVEQAVANLAEEIQAHKEGRKPVYKGGDKSLMRCRWAPLARMDVLNPEIFSYEIHNPMIRVFKIQFKNIREEYADHFEFHRMIPMSDPTVQAILKRSGLTTEDVLNFKGARYLRHQPCPCDGSPSAYNQQFWDLYDEGKGKVSPIYKRKKSGALEYATTGQAERYHLSMKKLRARTRNQYGMFETISRAHSYFPNKGGKPPVKKYKRMRRK